MRSFIRKSPEAAILLVLYVAVATFYNLTNPLFESPDEIHHFDFMTYVYENRALPVVDLDGPLTEYHQTPLYYVATAIITAPIYPQSIDDVTVSNPFWGYRVREVGRDNKNLYVHDPNRRLIDTPYLSLHIMRAFSTLYGAGAVLFIYLLAREVVDRWLALATASLAAFTPNYLLTTSSITNDAPVIFMATLIGFLLFRLLKRDGLPDWKTWLGLGLLMGTSVLVKTSVWPLMPISALVVTLLALRHRTENGKFNLSLFVTAGSLLLGGVLLVSGWWIARNLILYNDVTGYGPMWEVWGRRSSFSFNDLFVQLGKYTKTYWAAFGYSNIRIPEWAYRFTDALMLGGVAGLTVAFIRQWRSKEDMPALKREMVIVIFAWFVMTFAGLMWYQTKTYAVTGRQLYAVIGVIALGIVSGWAALLPVKHKVLSLVLSGIMFVYALVTWSAVGLHAYSRSPRLSDTQYIAEDDLQLLGWHVGEVATLDGFSISPLSITQGDRLEVTLYWKANEPTDENYVVFVQILEDPNTVFAGRDTYPGLGNDPTSYWEGGDIIKDTIPIVIETDGDGPRLLDVIVGMTDLETGERLPITSSEGNDIEHPIIGQVKLEQAEVPDIDPQIPLNTRFAGGTDLLGVDVPSTASPGDEVFVTLYWETDGYYLQNFTVFVHLFNDETPVIAQADSPPMNGRFPTTWWGSDEIFADQHNLVLPPELAPGTYHLRLGLYNPEDGARLSLNDLSGDQIIIEDAVTVTP